MKSINADVKEPSSPGEPRSTFYGAVQSSTDTFGTYRDLQQATSATSIAVSTHLVIDCSAVSYIDLTGAKVLRTLYSDLVNAGISLSLAGCTDPVMEQLDRYLFFDSFPRTQVYSTVIDAVLFIQHSERLLSLAEESHPDVLSDPVP